MHWPAVWCGLTSKRDATRSGFPTEQHSKQDIQQSICIRFRQASPPQLLLHSSGMQVLRIRSITRSYVLQSRAEKHCTVLTCLEAEAVCSTSCSNDCRTPPALCRASAISRAPAICCTNTSTHSSGVFNLAPDCKLAAGA